MKRIFISIIAMFALANSISADNDKTLVVTQKTGSETKISVDAVYRFYYENNEMILEMKSGEKKAIPVADISMMTFESMQTALNKLTEDKEEVSLYDLSGKKVDATKLSKGTYLVKKGKNNTLILIK